MSSVKPPLLWTNILIFSLTGLIALVWVPYHVVSHGFDLFEIIAAILCLGFCGMSITAGYHRLWAHRAYQAHPLLRLLFAIGGAFALQNSALHWASDHRVHHRHVDDNSRDPYSAGRGFWFSHIGWMLREYQPQRYRDYSNVRDLESDAIVMWQHKYYVPLVLLTNFGIPLLLGWWHGDILSSLLLAGVLRLVLSHHFTFFINSLAHIWGKQTFTDSNSARDNGLLAFVTYGEGYHNFHHLFEADYRNGIRWWQFDPTKWLIASFAWVGLTRNLRRAPPERIEQSRYAMQMKLLKEKLARHQYPQPLMEKLQQEYELLLEKLNAFYRVRKRLLDRKRRHMLARYERLELKQQVVELRRQFEAQRKIWRAMAEQLA